MLSKPLPYNIDAEEAVIGSLLLDPEALQKIEHILPTSDYFYRETHKVLYEAIVRLYRKGSEVDLITLVEELESLDKLDFVGGYTAVSKTMISMPTALHVVHYARIVAEHKIARRLIEVAEKISKLGYEVSLPIEERVEKAEQLVFALSTSSGGSNQMVRMSAVLSEFNQAIEDLYLGSENGDQSVGNSTGYPSLDELIGGFQKGDLVILAARPSMGKTAFALNMIRLMATKHQAKVGLFSLEMGMSQIIQRLMAIHTGIDLQRLRVGPIYQDDLERVAQAIDDYETADIFIDETPAISPSEMRSKLRRMVSEFGLDFVVVDYLQLMTSGRGRRSENRVQEVSYISRMLKELARELEVPVLALSQLSRGVEGRQDKHPMLSDLRDSGSIEQDADVVMFIYRDEVYNQETTKPNIAEIMVAKHRNGPTGAVEVLFDRSTTQFLDLSVTTNHEEEEEALPPYREDEVDEIIF